MDVVDKSVKVYKDFASFLWSEFTHLHWNNYLMWLVLLSALVYLFEIFFPWRKSQSRIRKDFWLDTFYMFFNIFIFPFLFLKVAATLSFDAVTHILQSVNLDFLIANRVSWMPLIIQLLVLFIVRDFTHWNVHRLLHRVPFLWRFHKVHHSVKEMGFAAHLRFHWMESVIYNIIQFIPLALLGFTLDDYIHIYVLTILIGHLNHANIILPLGPLKYIFNNPQMHIWHHAKDMPEGVRYGCNYGLSLSLWDYLFGTAKMPSDGKDIELGFEDDEKFPKGFFRQLIYGFKKGS